MWYDLDEQPRARYTIMSGHDCRNKCVFSFHQAHSLLLQTRVTRWNAADVVNTVSTGGASAATVTVRPATTPSAVRTPSRTRTSVRSIRLPVRSAETLTPSISASASTRPWDRALKVRYTTYRYDQRAHMWWTAIDRTQLRAALSVVWVFSSDSFCSL